MGSSIMLISTFASILQVARGIDLMKLDPCRLLCHMEHSVDECKLVSSKAEKCENLFWTGEERKSTIVDRIQEDYYIPLDPSEAVQVLKVHKDGCDEICESHTECINRGSECKLSGVCHNLFWKPGPPHRMEMTTCYQLAEELCDDGTPILCGNEPRFQRHDAIASNSTVTAEFPEELSPDDSVGESDATGPVESQSSGSTATNRHPIVPGLLVIPLFTRW